MTIERFYSPIHAQLCIHIYIVSQSVSHSVCLSFIPHLISYMRILTLQRPFHYIHDAPSLLHALYNILGLYVDANVRARICLNVSFVVNFPFILMPFFEMTMHSVDDLHAFITFRGLHTRPYTTRLNNEIKPLDGGGRRASNFLHHTLCLLVHVH